MIIKLSKRDQDIDEAALVPVPEGLADRLLLARRRRSVWRYASAAALALVGALSGLLALPLFDSPDLVQAVGPDHPAVAAITLVSDDRAELAQAGNAAEMEATLKTLGLHLERGGVHAYYAGRCQLSGAECELILLDTPDARANVVLLPGYPIAERVLVADRHMIALATPAKTGAYVVVADSPKVVKRMQRLFRRG